MIAALTIALIHSFPALASIGWASGRRDNRVAVAINADLPARRVKLAFLLAVTDDEYEAFERMLPVAEQHRRVDVTWQWRHLSRRRAMIAHVHRFTDAEYDEYEATLPVQERERRAAVRAAGVLRMVTLPGSQPVMV